MRKRFTSVLLAAVFALAMLAGSAWATPKPKGNGGGHFSWTVKPKGDGGGHFSWSVKPKGDGGGHFSW